MSISNFIKTPYYRLRDFIKGGMGTHSWEESLKRTAPDKSRGWSALHYIDFMFTKIFCPGLDGMDYFIYRFYELKLSERRKFITEGGLGKMVRRFNGRPGSEAWKQVEDKSVFNSLFPDLIGRKWIRSDAAHDELAAFCFSAKKVIAKPVGGAQGRDIFIAEINDGADAERLAGRLTGGEYLIEELIKQHADMEKLHPGSVNTLRIYTVSDKSIRDINITGAVLRIGRGESHTDNWHAGGMAAEIDIQRGVVCSSAVDGKGERYSVHPDTGVGIMDFKIPMWEESIDMVKEAHKRLNTLRYVAWDVAVCEDGVCLIEGNVFGGVHLQQQPGLRGKKEIYRQYL